MNKYYFYLLLFIVIFSSCSKDDNNNFENDVLPSKITQHVSILNPPYSYVNKYVTSFLYDSEKRITRYDVSTYHNDKLESERSTILSYEDGKIIAIKTFSETKEPIRTEYSVNSSGVLINGKEEIEINGLLQTTSYNDIRYGYDKNGNVAQYTYHPWDDERTRTLYYDFENKAGVFRNVNMPAWFIQTQLGLSTLSTISLQNNAFQERSEDEIVRHAYDSEYTTDNFPSFIKFVQVGIIYNGGETYTIEYQKNN